MSLLEMLPPYYGGSPEVIEFQSAVSKETDQAQKAAADLLLQLNVDTATWGLGLWEKAFGLKTEITEPYDYRRSRVKAKLRAQGTTTVALIKSVSESYSNGAVDVIEHPAAYALDIKFVGTIGIPPNMDDLTASLREIMPAHLHWDYIIIYNTWDAVGKHTWSELATHTWAALKESDLD